MKLKSAAKQLIPPVFVNLYRRCRNREGLYYFGNFKDWQSALETSRKIRGDYSDQSIFEKVARSIQEVRKGNAAYEQDSCLFYEDNIIYEVMASLMYVYAHEGKLDVLDFGGSLGSIYFRLRKFFTGLNVRWHIVEQEHFVKYGQENISEIDFQYKASDCFKNSAPNVLLISSAIQYLEEPYAKLDELFALDFKYIIIDRTAFLENDDAPEMIVCQNVPPEIYSAVYPCHLLSLKKFMKHIENGGYKNTWKWLLGGGIKIRKGLLHEPTREYGFMFEKS